MPDPHHPHHLTKMLDELTMDYLKMSGHLLKLIEMKGKKDSPEHQEQLLMNYMIELSEQAKGLITVMTQVATEMTRSPWR